MPKDTATKINARWLPAIDRLLTAGIRLGPTGKHEAINKVLQLIPEWTRGDCWRRIRQLRRNAGDPTIQPRSLSPTLAIPGTASRTRALPWTPADDDRLLNWAGYEPVKKIAQRLGRSERAVRFRMGALGMSAKVTDGWSLRSLRMLLHVSPLRLRFLISSGWLRVRDSRITATSFLSFLENQSASSDLTATAKVAAVRGKGDEAYSWERAASMLRIEVGQIQELICCGRLKIVDPFVTDRQFEEFCRKHGDEINFSLLDPATATWLVNEYGIRKAAATGPPASRAQKHALAIRACECGRTIAGNAYFRHLKACPARNNANQLWAS